MKNRGVVLKGAQLRALPTSGALRGAETLHVTHDVSFWDALILAACVEAGVETLYSEDTPGLLKVGALRVVNPFI